MIEEESWGLLTKNKFYQFMNQFTKRFGKPARHKRLSFSFWDHSRNNIDTRIRITEGKAEIIQKIGEWEGTHEWARSEQYVNLQSDVKEIFSTYQILRVLIPEENACYIYQYDNFIFKQAEFELKLTHQSGKTDKYNFEVEANTEKVDLNQLLKDLGLLKMVTVTSVKFWDKWNDELNLKDTDLNDVEIQNLIKKYLVPD